MRKLAIVLCVGLAACARIQNPLNVTRLAQTESAYGIALSAAVGYYSVYKINRCTKARPESAMNICARRSVVVKLQQADRSAQIALDAARDFVTNNPTLDAGSIISAAALAVETFRKVETDNGVQ